MFTIPTLPTDSLYKFLFFSGILLIMGALYFRAKSDATYLVVSIHNDSLLVSRDLSIREINDSIKPYENEENHFFDEETLFENKFRQFDKENHISTKKEKKKYLLFVDSLNNINITIKKNREKVKIDLKKHLKLEYKKTRIALDSMRIASQNEIADADYKYYHRGYNIMFVFGLLLTIGGGLLWYFKIQIFQDEIIKTQLHQLRQDVERHNAQLDKNKAD